MTVQTALRLVVLAVWFVGAACDPALAQDHASPRADVMRGHFAEAIAAHDAVARGDLAAARVHARLLASHRTDVVFPTGAVAFFTLLTSAADEVAAAGTIERAGQAVAGMLTRCGQCHRAMHVRAPVAVTEESRVGGVVGEMVTRLRAVDLLLEGLVAPSDARWAEGARALGRVHLEPRHQATGRRRAMARSANAQLARLAEEAARASRPPDRAAVYGRVLATCANCHQEHPAVWGPRREPDR